MSFKGSSSPSIRPHTKVHVVIANYLKKWNVICLNGLVVLLEKLQFIKNQIPTAYSKGIGIIQRFDSFNNVRNSHSQ